MKPALGLLAVLASASLSACNSGPSGEPCPEFHDGYSWADPTVTCGRDTFEKLDNYTAWRDIPESGPCPGTTCDDIEIVTRWDCPRLWVGDFRTEDMDPSFQGGEIYNVKGGVRYTLQLVDSRESVSAMAEAIGCLRDQ